MGSMDTRRSGECPSNSATPAETSPATAAAVIGSRDSDGAGQRGRRGQRDFEAGGKPFRLHTADFPQQRRLAFDFKPHRTGGEWGRGIHQGGFQIGQACRLPDAAHRLVQPVGAIAYGPLADFAGQLIGIRQQLRDAVLQQLV